MKFTEMRSGLNRFSGAQTSEYQIQYLANDVVELLNNLNDEFVEYLINDIIEMDIDFNLKAWMGSNFYSPSNENAKECLEICLKVKHIYGKKIKGWTDNALKCFDNILLKYIQDVREEKIMKYSSDAKFSKERDVYQHLIKLGGDLKDVGDAFDKIYLERNGFQHVIIVETNGMRIPKKFTNSHYNEKRDLIVGEFKFALDKLFIRLKKFN